MRGPLNNEKGHQCLACVEHAWATATTFAQHANCSISPEPAEANATQSPAGGIGDSSIAALIKVSRK